jgi:hypothetical protein
MHFDIFSNDLGVTQWAFGKNPSFRRAATDVEGKQSRLQGG